MRTPLRRGRLVYPRIVTAAAVSPSGSGHTYVLPAAGHGAEVFTSNILAMVDRLDLTTALAATDWNGLVSTLPNYLTVANSAKGTTLSISATSGGPRVPIATDGASTATLSSLLASSIT